MHAQSFALINLIIKLQFGAKAGFSILLILLGCREFEQKKGQLWAKQIVIDYWKRTDEGWLLAPLLKILSVIATEPPTPGGLSRSSHLEVKCRDCKRISKPTLIQLIFFFFK